VKQREKSSDFSRCFIQAMVRAVCSDNRDMAAIVW